jgi:xanthine dehydrogenase YagS FAD-binding subunit
MAVIRDMMAAFELFQPTSVDDAVALLDEHREDVWVLAGGMDSFDWFKDRILRPSVVVDLGGIESLRGVRTTNDGLEIGATTPLSEIVTHPEIVENYSLLVEAAELVASPQIRNQGTIGGNLNQDTRCWYYRDGWTCYRAGGNICYADTPASMNREHAILEADRCVAVNPSDTAPALIALDAQMVIQSSSGERVVNAEDFFIGPSTDITRMSVLQPGDLLTTIRVPATFAGAHFYFEKVRDRQVWDFPLVNVASAILANNGIIEEARIAVNGVAPRPLRMTAVENALRGESLDDTTAERVSELAVRGAKPLRHNAYKIPMMRNLVKRSIQRAEV